MKKIYGLGDIHFTLSSKWFYEAGNNFISWMEEQNFGNKEDIEIIVAGDVTDSDTNTGDVINQVYKLFNILSEKFSNVYVIPGNHDLKLSRGRVQYSIKFVEQIKNVHVIYEPSVSTTKNGFKVLYLPFLRDLKQKKSFEDYLTDLGKEFSKESDLDILVGHMSIGDKTSSSIFLKNGVDLIDYPKAKTYFVGHIHNRMNQDYLGSVWPLNKLEMKTNLPRGLKILDSERKESLLEFPNFLEFKKVLYPEKIEKQESETIFVYDVEGIENLQIARDFYENYHIKALVRKDTLLNKESMENTEKNEGSSLINRKSKKELLDMMISETNMDIKEDLYNECVNTIIKTEEK